MKPRTKIQKRVDELSKTLPRITDKQKNYAFKKSFNSVGLILKNSVICLECNHKFKDSQPPLLTAIDGYICPNCNHKLTIDNTSRKRVFKDIAYYGIITKCQEFQVLRYFWVDVKYKLGSVAEYNCYEVVQRWISPTGKTVIRAKFRQPFQQFYYDVWQFGSCMEVKSYDHQAYKPIPSFTYPTKIFIPEIKRNGFKGNFHGIKPYNFIPKLISSSKFETLLKAKQIGLLDKCISNPGDIEKYWNQIKICIRNNYFISSKDASHWIDYLGFLNYFGKDINNAKFVCPANINKEHDKYLNKRNIQISKEKYRQQIAQIFEDEKAFQEKFKKFFDIEITQDNIVIRPLKSVKEFLEEGTLHSHCVFSSSYYKKDNLILTAIVNNNRMETIEFSLSSLEVVQCRGYKNKNSVYHKQILDLLNKNKNMIISRLAS